MPPFLKKLALAAVAFAIMLGVGEVLLRTFAPLRTVGNIYWYQYDETLGIRLKPGMHSFVTTDYQAEMRTNALGTVNFQESFDGYEQLVFAIGDSYTQGTGLPSDASYPFQLDLILNMDGSLYEKRFGVVNLGLAAYGADQAMLALERYVKLIGKPDYILFFGCSNDYRDDELFVAGYRHAHIVAGNPRYGVMVEPLIWLGNEVQLVKRLKYAISMTRQQLAMARSGGKGTGGSTNEPAPKGPNVAELQEAKFDRLLELSERLGAELVVSWTDLEGKDHGDYEWLRQWAARRGVRFADWRPAVASVSSAIPDVPLTNSHSGGHRRSWVNRAIAQAYADELMAVSRPHASME